jgi:hypothetical protein
MRILRASRALAAVLAAAAVLRCEAFQLRIPVAGWRRASLACGRGHRARVFPEHGRMAAAPPRGDEDGEDGLAAGRGPKVNWSDRFKRALDMNPGRCSPSCLGGQCAWRVCSACPECFFACAPDGASVCVCVPCVCV